MRIIDGHAHVGRWMTPAFSGRTTDLSAAERVYRDELGYAGALVMPTDAGANRELLDAVRASEYPFRFCAWVDPEDGALGELLEADAEHVAALKIHPSFLRRRCTDPAFRPFLQWAAAERRPVLVHCGQWQQMASYRFVLDLADRYPEANFVLCHLGGDATELVRATVGEIERRALSNAHLGTESVRQYWIVREAIERLGANRVVFGSDYNLNHPRTFQTVLDALALTAEQRERVFFANLNGLLPTHLRIP